MGHRGARCLRHSVDRDGQAGRRKGGQHTCLPVSPKSRRRGGRPTHAILSNLTRHTTPAVKSSSPARRRDAELLRPPILFRPAIPSLFGRTSAWDGQRDPRPRWATERHQQEVENATSPVQSTTAGIPRALATDKACWRRGAAMPARLLTRDGRKLVTSRDKQK